MRTAFSPSSRLAHYPVQQIGQQMLPTKSDCACGADRAEHSARAKSAIHMAAAETKLTLSLVPFADTRNANA